LATENAPTGGPKIFRRRSHRPTDSGPTSLLHHPAFQSLALPLLLAVAAMAALSAWREGRFALWGALLGLLGALAWMPGFHWPADARHLKLPWVVLAALVVGVLLQRLWRRRDAAPGSAAVWAVVMVAAALGLAGLAAVGGSLLLAQLAVMLAVTAGAAGAWAGWRPSSADGAAPWVWLAFGLAWLTLAWGWVLGAPPPAEGHALRVAIVALAFLLPALLSRLCVSAKARRRRWAWAIFLAGLLAALPVTQVVVWPDPTATQGMPDTAPVLDDPYLTPSWR